LEIHQNTAGLEKSATIPDLRDYDPGDYPFDFFTVDGETLVTMYPGDYLVYFPSSSMNAMEVPIKAYEGTTPGFIMYVPIGESIVGSTLDLEYTFHRLLTSEPLFWISLAGMALWLIALVIFAIMSAQIKKYNVRHERDNVIINESIETFTGFIDAKDPYTNGHSKRVAIYTRCLAEEMGYAGEELDRIYYVALLHDCGKIGVPDSILGKPGKLTDEEFEMIKSHTVLGGKILSRFKSLENAGEGALYHHERYDGKGYPEGKAGEDIPLIARIICVADSYDAMNTNRVYRKKLPKDYILEELEKNKGRQFDPEIAEIMLRLLRENRLPSVSETFPNND
jgi:5'-deoxynucleotidase YfbR-like HD superfamily hydrolase